MCWRDGRRGNNIEDPRGARPGRRLAGSGIARILIVLAALDFGIDPTPLLQDMPSVSDRAGFAGASKAATRPIAIPAARRRPGPTAVQITRAKRIMPAQSSRHRE